MNEKTVCESIFKQKEMNMEHFTEIMARLINSIERTNAVLAGIIE